MFLNYGDLSEVFPHATGIKDSTLTFQTVSFMARTRQPKGLYIPISQHGVDLQEAIANGAIAAIWQEGMEVPSYTPNHFPILFTEDLLQGIKHVLTIYKKKLSKAGANIGASTNFLFYDDMLLDQFFRQTDDSELEKLWLHISKAILEEGRE